MHLPEWERCLAPLLDSADVRILEIGSFEGRSAVWMLQNIVRSPDSSITCIDPFLAAGQEERFDHNIRLTGRAQQVRKIVGFSGDVLSKWSDSVFDLIYIDGSHNAGDVLLDAFLCWPLLKMGGIIIFDDYLKNDCRRVSKSPKLGIDIFLKNFDGSYRLLRQAYQIILQRTR